LNINKTKFILFKPRRKKIHHDQALRIAIDSKEIKREKEAVFLGVIIESI